MRPEHVKTVNRERSAPQHLTSPGLSEVIAELPDPTDPGSKTQ